MPEREQRQRRESRQPRAILSSTRPRRIVVWSIRGARRGRWAARPRPAGYNAGVREESARRILLVQAIEEADRDGRLLAPGERIQASAAAREAAGEAAALLEARATRLLEVATTRASWVERALRATRFPTAFAWTLPIAAGAVGLLTDALGPERRVNILSVPLLGLIAWNLGAYVVLVSLWIARVVRRPPAGAPGPGEPAGAVESWGGTLAAWTGWRVLRQAGARAPDATLARHALGGYLARWRRLAASLFAARLKGLLHAGAALLAIGVLCGAYGRGMAFEYQATWESTFLDAGALRILLVALLGPASLLLGDPVPAADVLATLRAPAAGDAAPWVHRYALTTFLVVVTPRALLAAAASARARRLAADLPVDLRAPYFLRLLAGARPRARIEVRPYGYQLGPRGEERLRRLLHDLVGTAADVRIAPAAPYGAEPDEVLAPGGAPAGGEDGVESWQAVVFSLGQSPEDEVHGALLGRLTGWVAGDTSRGRRALALVDAGPYRALLAGTGVEAQRLADRRRAWHRLARDTGASLVHLDLDDPEGDEPALAGLERGVWPARASA